MNLVCTGRAKEYIVSVPAIKSIVALISLEHVISSTAEQCIDLSAAIQRIIADFAIKETRKTGIAQSGTIPMNPVISTAAVNRVPATAAPKIIVTAVAVNRIVAVAGYELLDLVQAGSNETAGPGHGRAVQTDCHGACPVHPVHGDAVNLATAIDQIGPAAGRDQVIAGSAIKLVIALATRERLDSSFKCNV